MHPQIEEFMQRPRSHLIGVWVGTLALIALLYWQYSYAPLDKEYTQLSEKFEELSQQVADESRRVRSLDKLKERMKELDIKLKAALEELPDRQQADKLLREVSELATMSGLRVLSFSNPREGVKRDFYEEIASALTVQGTYHQLATFFDEVAHKSRIVNINNLQLADPVVTESEVQIKTDCVATTFRYLDESERSAGQGGGGDKKRRR